MQGPEGELRNHERQAAEELSQWKMVIEEKSSPDDSPAAISLAMALSKEELVCCIKCLKIDAVVAAKMLL